MKFRGLIQRGVFSFFALAGLVLLLTVAPKNSFARYSDEIAVSQDEVWKAVQTALKPFGIRKINENKKTIETDWVQDRVRRSNRLLKNIPKQMYDRRYRMKVRLRDRAGDTMIEITGVFQQRIGTRIQDPWELIKPTGDDLDIEQDFFMKILNQLSNDRRDN